MDKVQPKPTRAETDRLWHELRESQRNRTEMTEAADELLCAVRGEYGNTPPRAIHAKCDQLLSTLPKDVRERHRVLAENHEQPMGRISKLWFYVGIPLMIAVVSWAYAVTP